MNEWIDPASGWTLTSALDINDSGWITGWGIFDGDEGHGFLLVPVPEPAATPLLAAACVRLLARRRIRERR